MTIETKNIEDNDNGKLELFGERLPTHKTKSSHTYLVARIQYPDYYDSEWHSEILIANGHLPESKNYTSKYEEKHCIACYNACTDEEKAEWDELDSWNEKQACECTCETFYIELLAVNPGIQTKETIADIESNFGGELEWDELDDEAKITLLVDRGTHAVLWHNSGIDEATLLDEAKKQYSETLILGGFKLDAPQNAIGSTGWDFMKGDILGGL